MVFFLHQVADVTVRPDSASFSAVDSEREFLDDAGFDFQFGRRKTLFHHHDEESSEKVEESDPKSTKDTDPFPLPLLSVLVQQTLSYQAKAYIFQQKHTSRPLLPPLTCYHHHKYILFQDFRT